MQLAQITADGRVGIGVLSDPDTLLVVFEEETNYPGSLFTLTAEGVKGLERADQVARAHGRPYATSAVRFLPPIAQPEKIICIGLNYVDHATEAGFTPPAYPVMFTRFASTLIGHEQPIVRPTVSTALDFEGELAVVIGRGGRHITRAAALDHVAGYSIFNDASVRDYQRRTSQWTAGKNFDATGAFGPYLVPASAVPAGARGLTLETRLNGELMQSASTAQMIFPVDELIATISEIMTLRAGDVIVSGTPSGVGMARNPPVYMKEGDVCTVAIERIGLLRSTIRDEAST